LHIKLTKKIKQLLEHIVQSRHKTFAKISKSPVETKESLLSYITTPKPLKPQKKQKKGFSTGNQGGSYSLKYSFSRFLCKIKVFIKERALLL
jgi:hypothetical protein